MGTDREKLKSESRYYLSINFSPILCAGIIVSNCTGCARVRVRVHAGLIIRSHHHPTSDHESWNTGNSSRFLYRRTYVRGKSAGNFGSSRILLGNFGSSGILPGNFGSSGILLGDVWEKIRFTAQFSYFYWNFKTNVKNWKSFAGNLSISRHVEMLRIRADFRTRLREEMYTDVKTVNVELQTSNSIFTNDDFRKSKTILLGNYFKIEKKQNFVSKKYL